MHRLLSAAALAVHLACFVPGAHAQDVEAVVRAIEPFDVATVGKAIGNRRVVLFGENGHGVAEFSAAKAAMVRSLHEHLGFEMVAFESGFHECREANERLAARPVRQVFRDCVLYQLEHREVEALIRCARERRESTRPLAIVGVDLQLQGYASRSRPPFFRDAQHGAAPVLADTVARLDSILVERALVGQDSLRPWIRDHGAVARALDASRHEEGDRVAAQRPRPVRGVARGSAADSRRRTAAARDAPGRRLLRGVPHGRRSVRGQLPAAARGCDTTGRQRRGDVPPGGIPRGVPEAGEAGGAGGPCLPWGADP